MNSKPRPQNEILVPFRGVFKNFRRAPPSFSFPPGVECNLTELSTKSIISCALGLRCTCIYIKCAQSTLFLRGSSLFKWLPPPPPSFRSYHHHVLPSFQYCLSVWRVPVFPSSWGLKLWLGCQDFPVMGAVSI